MTGLGVDEVGAAQVLPRSFLYVPATKPELFAKASSGKTDAVVLDLEDAVPLAAKGAARDSVRSWLVTLVGEASGSGARSTAEQWVRVDGQALAADLETAVHPGLTGLFLAKCTRESLREVASLLDRLERERAIPTGSVRVVGLVESAASVVDLATMARMPRLVTFGIGEADLLADLRMTRTERSAAALDALRSQVVVHCAAAGLQAPVAPTSTDFRDLELFTETSRQLLDLGFRSRTAVHPSQVPVINEVFSPTPEAVAAAEDVVERFEAARGGVTTDGAGRLVDAAVVRSARETLQRRH